jgi:hypothetical protein
MKYRLESSFEAPIHKNIFDSMSEAIDYATKVGMPGEQFNVYKDDQIVGSVTVGDNKLDEFYSKWNTLTSR